MRRTCDARAATNARGAVENGTVQDEPEEDPAIIAQRASLMARAALIIACMALAVSILGLFLPLRP